MLQVLAMLLGRELLIIPLYRLLICIWRMCCLFQTSLDPVSVVVWSNLAMASLISNSATSLIWQLWFRQLNVSGVVGGVNSCVWLSHISSCFRVFYNKGRTMSLLCSPLVHSFRNVIHSVICTPLLLTSLSHFQSAFHPFNWINIYYKSLMSP